MTLPSFEIEISNDAFGYFSSGKVMENIKLYSYVKPDVTVNYLSDTSCRLEWEKIPEASYYEVYQKMSDGSYKLLKKTTSSKCRINKLKNNKEYVFAVKATANIKAVEDEVSDEYIIYPEYYTIEGTRSDDVKVKI